MAAVLIDRTIAAGYRRTRRTARIHAKTFYLASHVLPPEKRRAAYAVYAFCRRADNAIDGAGMNPQTSGTQLAELAAGLATAYGTGDPASPELAALRDTVRRFNIPRRHFDDLLTGVASDLKPAALATFDDLLEYCYGVASTVGLIMARVFGVEREEALAYAEDLGTAMQLTNIIRDVREDLGMGRRYLPLDEMLAFGYDDAMLHSRERNNAFRRLMRFQIARARTYYASAEWGIGFLPDDGSRLCVRLMSRLYAGILDAVEARDYDVFSRRAALSLPAKIVRGARCLLQTRTMPPSAPVVRRRSDLTGRRVSGQATARTEVTA